MRLFIDCEWNGYRGDLISIALCSEDGRDFYKVLDCVRPVPWVAVNVMPVLEKPAMRMEHLREDLEEFLGQFENVRIIADWPEDIEKFCALLITGPGQKIKTPRLAFEVWAVEAPSKVPHNALWDARAIRDLWLSLGIVYD